MKRLTIITMLAAFAVSGCKKNILDTAPYGSIGSANMWTTDNFTDLGVAGVYQALRLGQNTGSVSGEEIYQYDRLGYTSQLRDAEAMLNATMTSSNGLVLSVWKDLYEGVHRSNDAIANIPAKSPSADSKKARYVAECKFLRAYFYLRLNQLWKGVPLYLEPVTLDQITKPRNTEQEVWDAIVKDLTDAINETNLPDRYVAKDPNYGHVTRGAAYALRGKAYIYQGKWAQAAADFQKVKDAGYALYTGAGTNSYFQLFKEANEESPEMIFSLQNISVAGLGSTTQKFCGNRSSFGSCWNSILVSPNLVDLYENADGSKFNWDAVLPGYNAMPAAKREAFFLRDGIDATERSGAAARGADMTLYLTVGNEARIAQAYANRDPRLGFNVITPYSAYKANSGSDYTAIMRWPVRGAAGSSPFDLQTDTKSQFYYLHRKFVYEGGAELINREYGPIDFPLIRYADVLLMWAEALNEQGDVAGALSKVNEVRARVSMPALQQTNTTAPTYVASQTDARERIRNERRVEFPNEGINFFDELRWKSYKDKVFATGNGLKWIWGTNTYSYTYLGDQLYAWPIPASERQRNPALTQNPGWID